MTDLDALLAEPADSVRERERTALDRLLSDAGGRIVLVGCGQLGRRALDCLREIGITPLAFADNDPARWHTRVGGIDVLPPGESAAQFRDALFLVTIWNSFHWYTDTERQLIALGCRRVAPVSALLWRFAPTFLPFCAQDLPHRVYDEAREVREALDLWSDEASRREYVEQVSWRARGTWTFDRVGEGQSYFGAGVYRFLGDEVVIDCGAYDGDTLSAFLALRQDAFLRYVAIEPDPQLFARLKLLIAALPPQVRRRVEPLNGLIGERRVTPSTWSIEDVADGHPPVTLIKMDIEGAEHAALAGARRIIERDQPVLTVCVYHTQSDLWRLPLMIKKMVPEYHMYLRRHEGDGWQTVAYAVPPERVPEAGHS